MVRRKVRGKLKDKWREKRWVQVEAPTTFGNTRIAYIPITSDDKALGRVLETTLYDLVKQDPQQYAVKLYFQIESVEGERALTVLKGHEYSREYLRSLVRRGSSTMSFIRDYETLDGFVLRIYFVSFAQSRINASRKHSIRLVAHKVLAEKSSTLTYDELVQDIILEKAASDIYNHARRITHLRKVGIRKTKLIKRPLVVNDAPSTPDAAELVTADA